MIDVECKVARYEDSGEPDKPNVKVQNHWNDDSRVIISVGGKPVTVLGQEMIDAINKCMS